MWNPAANWAGGAGNAGANAYNRRADRSPSGNSVKHRWIYSVVYELPFGKGRSFAIANAIADGGQPAEYPGRPHRLRQPLSRRADRSLVRSSKFAAPA